MRLLRSQKGETTARERGTSRRLSLWDLGPGLDAAAAFVDTAAIMKNLDLVITSDTAVAHLAGARCARVGGLAFRSGLALDAGPRRQPLVSHHASVPAESNWGGFSKMTAALDGGAKWAWPVTAGPQFTQAGNGVRAARIENTFPCVATAAVRRPA